MSRVVFVLLLGACSTAAGGEGTTSTTSTTAVATTTTTTTLPTTVTTPPGPTTTTSGIEPTPPPEGAEILIPDGEGPFPSVVLVHGGGWLVGDPSSMEPLARFLADNGYVAINATYQLSIQAPGFPTAVEDVACAIRYAATYPQSNGEVTVIGHSAGAHISALAAFGGSEFVGDCESAGPDYPDQFIGLAGPYDVGRIGPILAPFFGGQQTEIPDIWDAGNPQLRVADNPNLRSLLIHGDIDQVVPVDFSENLFADMTAAGSDVELVILEGVDHADARNPNIVGNIILDWIEP